MIPFLHLFNTRQVSICSCQYLKKMWKNTMFYLFRMKKLHLKSHSRRIGSNSPRLIIVVACITYLDQFCSKTNARFAHFDFDVQLIIAKFTVDFHLWGIAESCNGKCHFWGKSICTVFHKKICFAGKMSIKGGRILCAFGASILSIGGNYPEGLNVENESDPHVR